MVVDHIDPLVPIESHFEDMSIDTSIRRLWCDVSNLQAACPDCHDEKSDVERQLRKPFKKPRKKKSPCNKP